MNALLIHGEAIEELKKLASSGVKVDAVICDPPYGTTACKWDTIIPLDEMWEALYSIAVSDKTPIVLFGSEPFSSNLRMSNIKNYKYDWVWVKSKPSNFLNAKKQPMRKYESISVFYKKQCLYKPQGLIIGKQNKNYGTINTYGKVDLNFKQDVTYTNYPNNILEYANINGGSCLHPTQKPTDLLEYLINTYTNEGATILDFTMGSGSTGVACVNTNRNFIGIELDKDYYDIAVKRINDAQTD